MEEQYTDKWNNPCKGCNKRHERCHCECALYLQWSKLNTECREREYKRREAYYALSTDQREASLKKFKNMRNKNNRGRK